MLLGAVLALTACGASHDDADPDAECAEVFGQGCKVETYSDGHYQCQCCSYTFVGGQPMQWCRRAGPL